MALGGAPPALAAENLLENPSFESDLPGHAWMPAGWDTSDTGEPTAFFGRDTLLAQDGRYSVNVASVSTWIPMAYNWNQALVVGPEHWNRDAVFSIWTRSNGLEGRAYILVQAYRDTVSKMALEWQVPRDEALLRLGLTRIDDPIRDYGWRRQYFSEPTTGWVRREVRLFLPAGTNMVFVRAGLHGTGQVILDHASLSLEPALPTSEPPLGVNLLLDPSFEGDGNDWEYSLPPYAGTKVQRDTTVAHSGRASIRIQGQSGMFPARTGVGQVLNHRALAGKRVRASAWGRTDSLKTNASIKIFGHTPTRTVPVIIGPALSETTPWTQLSDEFDLPPDLQSLWIWFSIDTPAKGFMHWDDVSLEILGPAKSVPEGDTR